METNESVVLAKEFSSGMQLVPADSLKAFPGNRNIEGTDIDVLGDMIYKKGFSSTITIARIKNENDERGYWIIDGHRRVEALRYIYIKYDQHFLDRNVPALVLSDDLSMDDLMILNRSMNAMAKQETPAEQMERIGELAALFRRQGKEDRLAERIAESINKDRRTVYRYMNINDSLIPELKSMFKDGKIGMKAADKAASLLHKEYQEKVLDLYNAGQKITDDVIERLCREQDIEIVTLREENRQLKDSAEKEKEYERAKHRIESRASRERKKLATEKDYVIASERARADRNQKKADITMKALESDYLKNRKVTDDDKILDKIKVSSQISDIEEAVTALEREVLSYDYALQISDKTRLDGIIARLSELGRGWKEI